MCSFLTTLSIAQTTRAQLRYPHYAIWKLLSSLKITNLTLETTRKYTAPLPTHIH